LNNNTLNINTVGILGGGQLCQMLSEYLTSQNKKVYFIDPSKNPPAKFTNAIHIKKSYDDAESLKFLSEKCDVITYEFENIPIKSLEKIEKKINIFPSSYILSISQNRLNEKTNFIKSGIKTPKFISFSKNEELKESIKQSKMNFPLIIKTNTMGYDGKGQFKLENPNEIIKTFNYLPDNTKFIIEEKINFKKEISVIIGKDIHGNIANFEPIENIHKNGILDISIFPARVSNDIKKNAIKLSTKFIEQIELIGIIAIEMFVDKNENILFNEIAPRPHNSGHLTIESHSLSQFGMLGKIISGEKINKPVSNKTALMKNLLGDFFMKKNSNDILNEISSKQNHFVKLYNKEEIKLGRKMGHITILTDDIETSLVNINNLIN
jgi:5-(carboxyamino)imidazole ribonucleotide synthase